MNLTKEQYAKYIEKKSVNSPMWKNIIFAFFIGGAICTIGQGFSDLFRLVCGISPTNAAGMVSITMVFWGAFFTGVGLYEKLAKYAGAGTLVPITGFSNAIVSPAIEFKSEGMIMGIGAKMFIIAGPVLVYGILASVIYGVILYLLKIM